MQKHNAFSIRSAAAAYGEDENDAGAETPDDFFSLVVSDFVNITALLFRLRQLAGVKCSRKDVARR
jgi:hypothetical protein